MEEVLNAVLPGHGEEYVVENVDSDPEWSARYGEVIPVLLRDGKPVAKIRLDRRRLEQIVLARRSLWRGPGTRFKNHR